jgi:hypothetical protein
VVGAGLGLGYTFQNESQFFHIIIHCAGQKLPCLQDSDIFHLVEKITPNYHKIICDVVKKSDYTNPFGGYGPDFAAGFVKTLLNNTELVATFKLRWDKPCVSEFSIKKQKICGYNDPSCEISTGFKALFENLQFVYIGCGWTGTTFNETFKIVLA